jgi:rare lipoprotein A
VKLRLLAGATLLAASVGAHALELDEAGNLLSPPVERKGADERAEAGVPAQPEAAESARGIASWYGLGFHGRRTASGERFDMNAFTVAHPSLPLSSWVLVRNLSNDRVVVAKVTDRGPYHGKRILDMSYAAAKRLDFVKRGSTQVEIRRLSRAEVEALRPELTQTDVASNDGDADVGSDEPAPPRKKAARHKAKARR